VTGDTDERFRRDYAPVFLQYLSERGEQGRRAAYEPAPPDVMPDR
jgi:hypothetical protein